MKRIHEVELTRRVRMLMRNGHDSAGANCQHAPDLETMERAIRVIMNELGIPILPDGTIAVPEPSDDEIVRVACEIGRDWRDQGGVNAFLIDQLAEVTAPRRSRCG